VKGDCLCGRVAVTVPGRPELLNECNCAFCLKLGALWGYYSAADVTVAGETRAYVREDLADPQLRGHHCPTCGSTVSWTARDGSAADTLAINMRLFDPGDLRGVKLVFGDARNRAEGDRSRPEYKPATTFDGLGAR
jgi:hypothetical protein